MPVQRRLWAALLTIGLILVPTVSGARSTVLSRGQSICRQVALTFDGGSTAVAAEGILQTLAQHRARSTFFPTGAWVEQFPTFASTLRPAGHELANHSDTHPDMTSLTSAAMRGQLQRAEAKIIARTGADPRPFWRPPFGAYNDTVLLVASEEGYPWTLMWDIDTLDWQHPPASVIVDRVLSRVQPGSIVLMHLGGNTTAEAVQIMLPALERRGYMMVTIGEVLGLTRANGDFGGRFVHVQAGDTLSHISGCFNTTVPILTAANEITNPNLITPGQRLYIPLRTEVTIYVDQEKLDLATPALVINNRSVAHVRAVAEALGGSVSWDGTTQTVTVIKGSRTILMQIGNQTALVDGLPVQLDVPPFIVSGLTQVPVRFITEALDAAVQWDPIGRRVTIVP
jgi:peptidoglycan/xylan/chitin deacetylase (PgdA/CDA1 family)